MRKVHIFGVFLSLLVAVNSIAQTTPKGKSEWVYPDNNGKLQYKTTATGDRIIDFSHAGYMGGGVSLPVIAALHTVKPSGADDTRLIQSAIDAVAALPLKNGFRGAVQLTPGIFTCNGTITLPASGIVLRGSGSGKGGTTIKMVGERHTAIRIAAEKADQSKQPINSAFAMITDSYVPAGATTFSVNNIDAFNVGDIISISKPVTDAWLHFMKMDSMIRDGKAQTWISTSRKSVMERKIVSIAGKTIGIDVPLSDSYNANLLNPGGTTIHKVQPLDRITQVGVENLHIQCPPLEVSYGNAPYSGIRIEGDDCWVKDVYFEETMNTTTLAGNRITMQGVKIKHTYPNLGASKPTDFSLEGSQNLIDRCEVTGDNTYFVWTSSLVNGPNVILNSVFKGHGSRIQPHQRWATGMLVDNCVVPDGGIDFMNRGVAGSGHGWTMGWAVAWNCIAKTYIIQNPPGSINWAIGCIGARQQTARLFDSEPLEPEGVFDSYGIPVAPQSLYLAQLSERAGAKALHNIGYLKVSNLVTSKPIEPTPALTTDIHPKLGVNLALHRPVNASNIRNKVRTFGAEKAVDGKPDTYWATNDGITKGSIEVDTEGPLEINAIELSEYTGLGQRVTGYRVEGQVDSDWKLLSEGTFIGSGKMDRFQKVTVWKVRLTILSAKDYPAINKVAFYLDEKN